MSTSPTGPASEGLTPFQQFYIDPAHQRLRAALEEHPDDTVRAALGGISHGLRADPPEPIPAWWERYAASEVTGREAIRQAGGVRAANSYTKFYLAMLGQIPWNDTPAVPPELMLLPNKL